jgi:predicted metallopeptidase
MAVRNRLQRAQAYVDEAKDLLNLSQWEIKVQDYPSADDAYADIEPHDYLWHAKLRLSEDFWKEKPEDQAKIIAHELLHLHYAGVERIINHLEPVLGGQTHDLLSKFWEIEVERAADALSGPVGGLLTQPDFTK